MAAPGGIECNSGFDDIRIGQFANRADGPAQMLGGGGHAEKPPVGHLDQCDRLTDHHDVYCFPTKPPVPLDVNILRALKRSAMGLDLYMWLTYRTFNLKKPVRIYWRNLYRRFGVHPSKMGDRNTVNDFLTKSLRELKKIKEAWPVLN